MTEADAKDELTPTAGPEAQGEDFAQDARRRRGTTGSDHQ